MTAQIPIVCVGSGAALGDGRLWSSLLVDGRILLDLPPTTVPQMHRLGLSLDQIDIVLITHLHGDHVFGLPFLLLEYCVRVKRTKPVHIIGPKGLVETSHQLCDIAWPNMRAKHEADLPVQFIEVDHEDMYQVGDLTVTAMPMAHFDLEAYGYRFEYKGRTFAYTGDTGEGGSLDRLIHGVDVAIIECTHLEGAQSLGHLDAESIERATRELRARGSKVFATHFSQTPELATGITECEDAGVHWV